MPVNDPGIPETGHFKTTLDPRAHELQVIANDAFARLASAEAECERLRAVLERIALGAESGEIPRRAIASMARIALGDAS